MNRRHLFGLTLGALTALSVLGCGKPWQVISQANPNPLKGERRFSVQPVDTSSFTVGDKTEAAYLSDKDAEGKKKWEGDKKALTETFLQGLKEEGREEHNLVISPAATESPFHVVPKVDFIEPGLFTGVFNKESKVEMTIKITTPDGKLVDEIRADHSSAPSLINSAIGTRLRSDAEGLGKIVAEYLGERVNGE